MKAANTEQRNKHKEWVKQGRPRNRDNAYYKTYKDSRRLFRNIQKEAINKVEFRYYSDLDSSADCDKRLFWQLVKKRRKTKPSYISTIKAVDKISNSSEEIAESFANYFSNTFVPNESEHYDDDFKAYVESQVKSFDNEKADECDDLSCPVELSELIKVVKGLKRRKSPDVDNVTNEHIIYGGKLWSDAS